MGSAITFDTLLYAKKLKEAGFTERQAEIQAEALVEIVEDKLATKQDIEFIRKDIKELELRTDVKLAELKTDLIKWVVGIAAAQIGITVSLLKLLSR